ncbi:MAG: hypothetical protein WAQ52_13685 [Terriglobales bacterium]
MKYPGLAFTVVVLASLFARTSLASPPAGKQGVKKESFGTLPDGTSVDLYTMTNAQGMEIRATNYGGIVVSLRAPDKKGDLDEGNVTLEIVGQSLFWRDHWTVWEPHCEWEIHARRKGIYAGEEHHEQRHPVLSFRHVLTIGSNKAAFTLGDNTDRSSGRDKAFRTRFNVDRCVFEERLVHPLVSPLNLPQPTPPHSDNVHPLRVVSEDGRHRIHVVLVPSFFISSCNLTNGLFVAGSVTGNGVRHIHHAPHEQ